MRRLPLVAIGGIQLALCLQLALGLHSKVLGHPRRPLTMGDGRRRTIAKLILSFSAKSASRVHRQRALTLCPSLRRMPRRGVPSVILIVVRQAASTSRNREAAKMELIANAAIFAPSGIASKRKWSKRTALLQLPRLPLQLHPASMGEPGAAKAANTANRTAGKGLKM